MSYYIAGKMLSGTWLKIFTYWSEKK